MTNDEQLTLWVGAFRYYLGRMTYAVGEFCWLLINQWPELPEMVRILIQRDLEEAFERDDKLRQNGPYTPLGADCDRAEWEKVRSLWRENNE